MYVDACLLAGIGVSGITFVLWVKNKSKRNKETKEIFPLYANWWWDGEGVGGEVVRK